MHIFALLVCYIFCIFVVDILVKLNFTNNIQYLQSAGMQTKYIIENVVEFL